jgi:hypothetical protein
MYLIKLGTQYVSRDGTLTDSQGDAMRLDVDPKPADSPRLVHLKLHDRIPHGDLQDADTADWGI